VKVIVGLGNPGVHYRCNRHNIGFRIVDRLAEINHILISTKRFKALYGTGGIDSQEVVLTKPLTFMNRSGEAVKKLVDFFHSGMGDLVVIHDDLDLSFGRLRFKQRGGDGGHQGVRSIIEAMDGNNFLRLKVGIGRPPKGMDVVEFVLNDFDQIEQFRLDEMVSRAAEALTVLLSEGLQTAMNRYQKKGGTEEHGSWMRL
jgi:PTH1 family peptidyl-tRNA hydrolase